MFSKKDDNLLEELAALGRQIQKSIVAAAKSDELKEIGSDFLFADTYYDSPAQRGKGDVTQVIAARTVAWLRVVGTARCASGTCTGTNP